jgi:hypothetical protein
LKNRILRPAYWVFFLSLAWISCDPLPCVKPALPQLKIDFVADSSGYVIRNEPALDSVQIKQHGKILFTSKSFQNAALKLPVPSAPSFFWLVFWATRSLDENIVSLRDSVYFSYQPQPKFLSEECGYQYMYQDLKSDSLGGSLFKKLKVTQSLIDTSQQIHVQIFL